MEKIKLSRDRNGKLNYETSNNGIMYDITMKFVRKQ